MRNPDTSQLAFDDTLVQDMPLESCSWDHDTTQPIPKMTMDELASSGPTVSRSYSRDLEVRPDITTPRTRTRTRIASESDGVPLVVKPERAARARRDTLPFGSRGAGPAVKVG